jgi:chaperonin cofactor prefoldin
MYVYTDALKTRSVLLDERVKSLEQQNEQLSNRNKASQNTFEQLQHSAAEVNRALISP